MNEGDKVKIKFSPYQDIPEGTEGVIKGKFDKVPIFAVEINHPWYDAWGKLKTTPRIMAFTKKELQRCK